MGYNRNNTGMSYSWGGGGGGGMHADLLLTSLLAALHTLPALTSSGSHGSTQCHNVPTVSEESHTIAVRSFVGMICSCTEMFKHLLSYLAVSWSGRIKALPDHEFSISLHFHLGPTLNLTDGLAVYKGSPYDYLQR